MSWQDYVDKQLLASRCVTKAAIAGHDGNVWAKSEGFEVSSSSEEISQKNGRERKREKESESERKRANEWEIVKREQGRNRTNGFDSTPSIKGKVRGVE